MLSASPVIPVSSPPDQGACVQNAPPSPVNASESTPDVIPKKPFSLRDVAHKWTPAQAKEASRRRWERFEAQRAGQTPPVEQNAPQGTQGALQGTLSQTERENLIREYKELAAASRKQLLSLTDPKDRHQEASTLAKLEACYWRYAGIPGEGTLKPTTAKPRDRRMDNLGPVG